MQRAIILVIDGVGCGQAPDAEAFGDAGANTLGNLSRAVGGLHLPRLQALGLGAVTDIVGVPPTNAPLAAVGIAREQSAGKDTITGHWEMAGLVTRTQMPVYPQGFPPEILDPIRASAGRGVLGNKPASGTTIIEELGPAHLESGKLIVYTSADSVLQIAAHTDVVPLPELYRVCEAAREICDAHGIGRVIARPFVGRPGAFTRTYDRKDWPLLPPGRTLLDHLQAAEWPVVGVGKISDIFGGQGIGESVHTAGNDDGMAATLRVLARVPRGLVFVNLVDFDMLYGHRNDARGFAAALGAFDAWLPALQAALAPGDVVFVTADHGNDPTFPGTDHTRECAPLLAFGPGVRPAALGVRGAFADLGQTIAHALGVGPLAAGASFWQALA